MKNRFDIFLSDENVNEETNEGDQKRSAQFLSPKQNAARKVADLRSKISHLSRNINDNAIFESSRNGKAILQRSFWVSENEVEEVNDATASFMVQNELSNDSDVSMTHVRGGVTSHPSNLQ
ncbi:hypothetical protein Tco_1195025 [Tanacetum coccineum]